MVFWIFPNVLRLIGNCTSNIEVLHPFHIIHVELYTTFLFVAIMRWLILEEQVGRHPYHSVLPAIKFIYSDLSLTEGTETDDKTCIVCFEYMAWYQQTFTHVPCGRSLHVFCLIQWHSRLENADDATCMFCAETYQGIQGSAPSHGAYRAYCRHEMERRAHQPSAFVLARRLLYIITLVGLAVIAVLMCVANGPRFLLIILRLASKVGFQIRDTLVWLWV